MPASLLIFGSILVLLALGAPACRVYGEVSLEPVRKHLAIYESVLEQLSNVSIECLIDCKYPADSTQDHQILLKFERNGKNARRIDGALRGDKMVDVDVWRSSGTPSTAINKNIELVNVDYSAQLISSTASGSEVDEGDFQLTSLSHLRPLPYELFWVLSGETIIVGKPTLREVIESEQVLAAELIEADGKKTVKI